MSEISSADSLPQKGGREISDRYLSLRYRIGGDSEDRFVAEMWSLPTLGLERLETAAGEIHYLTYFRLPLEPAVSDLASGSRLVVGSELVEVRNLADEDWLAKYRDRSQPFALGRRWWVDPRQPGSPEVPTPADRQLLRIPAWTAFGTGSHASTALLVRLLEDLPLRSRRVLDVGTGTGILAMVALVAGASQVTALDVDPVAACVASQTCRLNRLKPQILAGRLSAVRTGRGARVYDVALANVIPTRLRPDLPALVSAVKTTGQVLLSGILQEQEAEVVAKSADLGLRYRSRLQSDGWVALAMERTAE